jgi:hypothetical protein
MNRLVGGWAYLLAGGFLVWVTPASGYAAGSGEAMLASRPVYETTDSISEHPAHLTGPDGDLTIRAGVLPSDGNFAAPPAVFNF